MGVWKWNAPKWWCVSRIFLFRVDFFGWIFLLWDWALVERKTARFVAQKSCLARLLTSICLQKPWRPIRVGIWGVKIDPRIWEANLPKSPVRTILLIFPGKPHGPVGPKKIEQKCPPTGTGACSVVVFGTHSLHLGGGWNLRRLFVTCGVFTRYFFVAPLLSRKTLIFFSLVFR